MMLVLLHNMGSKKVDFGQLTEPENLPQGLIFLTEEPRKRGDFCLYDEFNFFTPEEARTVLYELVSNIQNLKNSS